jgi:phenylpropionate dioxygenase-like ring-hydroxylating dioxygenase large terminal subunit
MPAGLIEPSLYRVPAHHARELQGLFRQSWVFAGLLLELQGLAHQVLRLGDTEVLLQCDSSGTPRAFLNACAHRHAQLCSLGKHTGPVRCPYHGWVYDREGVPVGIPGKQAFPEVVAQPEQHRLTEFNCEAAGQFVFVRLASEGPGLRDWLGNEYEFLERASQGMCGITDEFQKDVDANWKVVIENSLEGYHVPAVHSKTFMQVDGMSREETAPLFFLDDPRHSHLEHTASAAWISSFARLERKVGLWPWRFEHYTHHLIFPNLTVTSFMGYSFHIQRFDPTAPELTTVHSRTTGVNFEGGTEMGRKMMERIYADGHAFTHMVFGEDSGICAKVQSGLRNAQRLAVLGEGVEDRVLHFQRAYVAATK